MKKSKVIQALTAQANADKAKSMMALDLLENQAVGIGDHTVNDFMKDATEALELLKKAVSRNPKVIRNWAKDEPIFTVLHNDDKFRALVKL